MVSFLQSIWSSIRKIFTKGGSVDTTINTDISDTTDKLTSKRILSLALNRVDKRKYNGWPGTLKSPEYDSERIVTVFDKNGYSVFEKLTESVCFRDIDHLVKTHVISGLKSGDRLVIFYSGHGGQQYDYSGDEEDNMDETLCFFDGQVSDDIVFSWLKSVPKGVLVLLITDCCNSETMARTLRSPTFEERFAKNPFACDVVHIAGCGDGESSLELPNGGGGVLTNNILDTIQGVDNKSLREVWEYVKTHIDERQQTPRLTVYSNNTNILDETVF